MKTNFPPRILVIYQLPPAFFNSMPQTISFLHTVTLGKLQRPRPAKKTNQSVNNGISTTVPTMIFILFIIDILIKNRVEPARSEQKTNPSLTGIDRELTRVYSCFSS